MTTDQYSTVTLFGIVSLMSSMLIYNLEKRIQEDDLQNIALFTEYSKIANNFKNILPDINILIRDFQNFEEDITEENINSYCNEYLTKVLQERDIESLNHTRKSITYSYNSISCNILPHPGFKIIKKHAQYDSNNFEPDFVKIVNYYVNGIILSLKEKKIANNSLDVINYTNLIETYVNLFNDSKDKFPNALTLLEAVQECHLHNLKTKSIDKYINSMNSKIGNKYCVESFLQSLHIKYKTNSLNYFDTNKNVDDWNEKYPILRIQLEEEIENKFKYFHEINKQRNPLILLKKYVNPTGVCISGIALNMTTSTCYNISSVCVQGYSLSSALLFLAIPYTMYDLYNYYKMFLPSLSKKND